MPKACAIPGNPYDSHTLERARALAQASQFERSSYSYGRSGYGIQKGRGRWGEDTAIRAEARDKQGIKNQD